MAAPSPRHAVTWDYVWIGTSPSLPEQEGPAGQTFAAIDPVLTFSNWGPRVGVSADLTGDGRTALKLHYGKFWVYPAPNFTAAFNPNPPGWSQTYLWPGDANSNGRWDPGEEGPLRSESGGTASTRLDPGIENTRVHQGSAYLEREMAPGFGVRTGVVLSARRAACTARSTSAGRSTRYSAPVTVADPGPDGRSGSADDGATVTAYGLTAEALGTPTLNLTTNLPDSASDYYTWEITATKRYSGRGSLLASFTHTWSREAALGAGNDFTPNALINAAAGQDRFRTWQAKLNGTVDLPRGFRIVPIVRHQSGQPFARTFVQTLNYGNATIKAEPIAANRMPDITLVDVRTEKDVPRDHPAGHGLLRRLQHFQHQCRPDDDHQLGELLVAAHGDHRASRPPDRRPAGMVTTGTQALSS